MRIPATIRDLRRSETGASAVEFALIFPFFLLVTGAVVEAGYYMYQRIQLESSIQAAGQWVASAYGSNIAEADLQKAARSMARTGYATKTAFYVCYTPEGDQTGCPSDTSEIMLIPSWKKAPAEEPKVEFSHSSGGAGVKPDTVRISASLPYEPLIPAVTGFMGMKDLKLEASHEEALRN